MLVWLLVITLLALVYYYAQRSFRYWSDRGIPQLDGTLPMGSMKGVGKKLSLNELLDRAYRKCQGQSPVTGLYFLVNPVLVVSDLDLAKRMLVKDFNSFHDRGLYVNERDDPLSGHLFAIDGERWRYLRSKLSPTFTSGKIKHMFGTIREIGSEFLGSFEQHIDAATPIDIKLLCQCFTCDVVGSCAFGLRCNSLKNGGSELLQMADRVFRQSSARIFYSILQTTFPRVSRMLRLPAFPVDIKTYFLELVRSTVAHREQNGIERSDFLQLLMQLKTKGTLETGDGGAVDSSEKLTLDEVSAQAFVFFFAGFETSATTLSFALFLLASEPAVQERCREEILAKLASHDNAITYEALKEMTYLDQVINETLRMYSPVGMLMRTVTEPYRLPEPCNVTLEKGTMVMVPVQAYHHDPALFPDPERFDPARFAPEAIKDRHSLAFIPFGEGPRNCIGMRFGLLEVKFGIVQVLSKLRLTVDSRTVVPLELNKSAGFPEANGGIWLNAARLG